MGKKKNSEKKLKAEAEEGTRPARRAEKSAEKWKAQAKKRRETDALKSELTAVRRRLEKATPRPARWRDGARRPRPQPSSAEEGPGAKKARPGGGAHHATRHPPRRVVDRHRLRAEARARGVAGYSRKTKAQLLADLGG